MTVNFTLEQNITRAALQALIAGVTVVPKQRYRITDAVGSTIVVMVIGETTSTISGDAIDKTNDLYGVYNISADTFTRQGDPAGTAATLASQALIDANLYTDTQVANLQVNITRAALQALMSGSTVVPERAYRVTDAVGSTKIFIVYGQTTTTISSYGWNITDNRFGRYNIGADTISTVDIPLSGTVAGDIQTGNVENNGNVSYFYQSGDDVYSVDFVGGLSVQLAYQNGVTGANTRITIENGDLTIATGDGTDSVSFDLQPNSSQISGSNAGYTGLRYAADYGPNFVDRSLIDLGYFNARVPRRAVAAGDVNNSTVTLADITGLSFAHVNGEKFFYTGWIAIQAPTSATGARIAPSTTGSGSFLHDVDYPTAAGTRVLNNSNTATQTPAVSAATTAFAIGIYRIVGYFTSTGDGTFSIQFASETAAVQVTALAHWTHMRYEKLN